MDFLKKSGLLFVVFLTGACVLIIEVVATRILSPYFGNTIFTVSSVISVVLAALSVGYYAGGKLADARPSEKIFYSIILIGGLSVLFLQMLNLGLLPFLGYKLSLINGPLISALILFFAPSFLLGTLSPFAIKLQKIRLPEKGIGSIAGEMFFWSTFGSIFGSLATGFIFIPRFGIDRIVLATGIVLCLLGLFPLIGLAGVSKKKNLLITILILISFFLINFSVNPNDKQIIYRKDGVYEKLSIIDTVYKGRATRFFYQDKSLSGGMYLNSDESTFEYTKYYALYNIFKPNAKDILIIGGGIYTMPKYLSQELPEANIIVSEIEPSLFELSKTYFNLPKTTNIINSTTDGRRLLHDTNKKFDFIFSDAYYSLHSIPAHFTTQEFFQLAKNKLNDDGILAGNFIGNLSRQSPSFIFSEIKTFQSVFPNSYFFAVNSPKSLDTQNIIFVGFNSDKKIDFDNLAMENTKNEFLKNLSAKIIDLNRFDISNAQILTDNYAPVDYYVLKALNASFANRKKMIDGKEMLALIKQQLNYGPRSINTFSHKQTQKLIKLEMDALADETYTQNWEQTFSDKTTIPFTNIIGRFYPEKTARIILATHYDSKKNVPGANDSASGAAVLMELARYISLKNEEPTVGIDIIFFDGEEGYENASGQFLTRDTVGSIYFANNIKDLYKEKTPIGAIVLDMVCDKNLKIYKEKFSVEYAPQMIEKFWTAAQSISAKSFDARTKWSIVDDHTPLNNINIPSILLIDFDYPPFHTAADTIDKCNAKNMEVVGDAILKYVYTLNK